MLGTREPALRSNFRLIAQVQMAYALPLRENDRNISKLEEMDRKRVRENERSPTMRYPQFDASASSVRKLSELLSRCALCSLFLRDQRPKKFVG